MVLSAGEVQRSSVPRVPFLIDGRIDFLSRTSGMGWQRVVLQPVENRLGATRVDKQRETIVGLKEY